MPETGSTLTVMDADEPYPGYCPAHAAAAARHGWEYIPHRFPGCPACEHAPGFDPATQPHLVASGWGADSSQKAPG
jgi:hypothetical protein